MSREDAVGSINSLLLLLIPGHPPCGVQYTVSPLVSVMDITVALHAASSLHHRAATAAVRSDREVMLSTVGDESVRDATVANRTAGVGVVVVVVVAVVTVDASADVIAIRSCWVVGGVVVVRVVVNRNARDPG